MSRKRKTTEEKSPGVPVYIVTFSDMVTLLLTFFVMLLSMAENQCADMFEVGQTAFKRALADFGVSGFVISRDSGVQFDHPQVRYPVDEGKDKPEDRAIDAETEKVRRVVLELEQKMEISPGQTGKGLKEFHVSTIRFRPGGWELNDEAKTWLTNFSRNMQASMPPQNVTLYVLGLGNSETNERQQWVVSARRAQEATQFFQETLPAEIRWNLYSWGAGPGGDWTENEGLITPETEILIATIVEEM